MEEPACPSLQCQRGERHPFGRTGRGRGGGSAGFCGFVFGLASSGQRRKRKGGVRGFVRLSGCVWIGLQSVSDDEASEGLGLVLRCSGGRRFGFKRAATTR